MLRNNDYIKYDLALHRYVLTKEYVRDKLGIELSGVLDSTGDINPETLPDRFLNQVSIVLYNFIYKYAKNKKATEYMLATNDDYIDCLQEAMGQLVLNMLLENNNLSIITGVNLENGKMIDRLDIMRNTVPVNVEDLLRNGNLLYRGLLYVDYKVFETRGVDY